ncbi:MAG: serine/threonine protein kinase, partial [Polyangiaceae bacterium]|nr:serine/threonine protein kinase [Polyangiaceae bacterium]
MIPGTDYRVVRLLGRGGFGEVFEVEHVHLTRRFAVKVLSHAHAGRGDLVERLKREARSLARLHPHPNLVEVTDLRESSDGRAFLVMERLQGRTLGQTLKAGHPVPSGLAADVMRQLLRALGAAHRIGLVHRDVKPSNVFLCEGGTVKLLDFGIVKVLAEDGGVQTTPGAAIGTPGYMAPEYIAGSAPDARSDVYGAGVVFWEMLAGRAAFAPRLGEGGHELLARVVAEGVPTLESSGRGDLPEGLREVVRKATARHPEKRFSSADDFGLALETALRCGDLPRPARVLKAAPAPGPQGDGGAGEGQIPLRTFRGSPVPQAPQTWRAPHGLWASQGAQGA